MSCNCKNKKHKCAIKGCFNHVMKGKYIDRYLGLCEYHFENYEPKKNNGGITARK